MLLSKYKVLEYSTYVAAPSAGGMLADWGAQVTKIEPLRGDPIRGYFNSVGRDMADNPIFDVDNRGKRSIALDTAGVQGAAIIRRLLAETDVFLTNLRPGSLQRAGLDWDSVREINPRLVFASVTGYGLAGDDRDRPGFDVAAYWARGGVANMTVPKGAEPLMMRIGVGDHVTGLAVVSGILAALLEREGSGAGRLVEVSLLRTGIYSVSSELAIQQRLGRVASNRERHRALNPLNNFFRAADGNWVCILARHGPANTDWREICTAIGVTDLVDDPRFATPKDRRANAAGLIDLLDAAFGKLSLQELAQRLDAEDVAWAPVQSPAQVLADPQAQAAGAFVDIPTHAGGSVRSIAGPVRFHGIEHGPRAPTPLVGEHTAAVLSDIGFSPQAIAALADEKVVALGAPAKG
jgi:crotonobetainyl-CoA:carnitine CoA-transferase CaiB-like acyl-CoA transferase